MNKESGFTLIELIIVIIILGILSSTALPRFIDLQSDAREATMEGLSAALESASTITYTKASLENKTGLYLETLSSGIKVRYGFPYATQTNLKLVLDFNEDDWTLAGSYPTITFTISNQVDGLSKAEILASDSLCKLKYTGAEKDERPDISISGCTD